MFDNDWNSWYEEAVKCFLAAIELCPENKYFKNSYEDFLRKARAKDIEASNNIETG